MNITTEEIQRLAKLSRLALGSEEIEKLKPSMEKIIGYIKNIKEVDLSNVEPTTRMSFSSQDLRPDIVSEESFSPEAIFRNAPKVVDSHFSIPKTFS